MQMCGINDRELLDIEQMIFNFLWNKKWVGSLAPDRIKRVILKQSYSDGGLQVPDVKFLDSTQSETVHSLDGNIAPYQLSAKLSVRTCGIL